MYVLLDVASDYSLSPVDGKYQYGDLAHAKKRAQELTSTKIKWQATGAAQFSDVSKAYAGFIHDDEMVYKIFKTSKDAIIKEKITMKNPDRITQAWLDKRVSLLNEMLKRPLTQYTKKPDGGLTGNRGHLFIDHGYGGVKVAEMAGRGTGENNISDGYVSKPELNNFINGMIAAVRLTERKRNPITPGQLESFVNEMDGSGRDELKGAYKLSAALSKDARVSAAKRTIYKDLAKLLRKELKKFDPSRNPKMAKKKRSAKQLANDKRLGRMAKARAKGKGKKKTSRKKATRRKANPKRTAQIKSSLWLLFRCLNGKIQFYNGGFPISKQWGPRSRAALFRSRGHASASATKAQKSGSKTAIYGAAQENTTTAKIKDHCNYEMGKT